MGKLLEHRHLIVRAEVKYPPINPKFMENWMSDMVKAIGMQELCKPRAIYSDMIGNRGLTCDVILNTSNAVIHTWDEVDPGLFMIDVYSCAHFDPKIIFELLEIFGPTKIEFMFLDRKNGLELLNKGVL